MDANKLEKLKEVGYTIHRCCGMCRFGEFADRSDFGTCSILRYEHLKHTDAERHLSVNRYGSCKSLFNLTVPAGFGVWGQFIEG